MADNAAAVFVAYRAEARPDALAGVTPYQPVMPNNITVPATQQEWRTNKAPLLVQQKTAERERLARECKLLARVTEIVMFDPSDPVPHKFTGETASSLFVRALCERYPKAFSGTPREHGPRGVILYGANLKPFVRITGLAARLAGIRVPIGYWYMNEDVLDPFEMLVEKEAREFVTHGKVLTSLGIKLPEDLLPLGVHNYQPGDNLINDVRISYEVAVHAGLLPELIEVDAVAAAPLPIVTPRVVPKRTPAAASDEDEADEDDELEEPDVAPARQARPKSRPSVRR